MIHAFVTTDLGGLHVRCPACRRHRPGSDFLRTETRCRDCDGGAYERSLARRGDEIEGRGDSSLHPRWVPAGLTGDGRKPPVGMQCHPSMVPWYPAV